MTRDRVKTIDVARGIAMICIVLGHLGIESINRIVFTFHVPVFYLITGYFMKREESLKDFAWKKFRTLIIPYLVTCILVIAMAVLVNLILDGGNGWKQVFLEWLKASLYGAGDTYYRPFYVRGIGAVWFLLATFWASLFLQGMLKWQPQFRLCCVIALFCAGYWSRKWFWFPFSIQAGCCATLYLYIGYQMKELVQAVRQLSPEIKAAWTVFALTVWICFMKDFQSFWLVHCDIGRGVVDIFGSICGCYMIFLFSWLIEKHCSLPTKMLSFLGQYSIFALCAHVVESNTIPWFDWVASLNDLGLPFRPTLVLFKFIWICTLTYIGSKWKLARRAFGLKTFH